MPGMRYSTEQNVGSEKALSVSSEESIVAFDGSTLVDTHRPGDTVDLSPQKERLGEQFTGSDASGERAYSVSQKSDDIVALSLGLGGLPFV